MQKIIPHEEAYFLINLFFLCGIFHFFQGRTPIAIVSKWNNDSVCVHLY